ncbi:MAG: HAD hydrolase family protein [bacterium]|nr:HAD hydrolase family protein [bacterium]
MRKKIIKKSKKNIELKNIRLVVYDCDGVLTDNKVILREDGLESVSFNRSDGLAIGMIKKMGIDQIILSKERNKVVEARANKLGILAIRGIDDKKKELINYCIKKNISLKNVVYIGNDINDLEPMKIVGYPICPADAYEEIKEIVTFIIDVNGGSGVVRELIRYIKK